MSRPKSQQEPEYAVGAHEDARDATAAPPPDPPAEPNADQQRGPDEGDEYEPV